MDQYGNVKHNIKTRKSNSPALNMTVTNTSETDLNFKLSEAYKYAEVNTSTTRIKSENWYRYTKTILKIVNSILEPFKPQK